jgi:hypothetical protein
MRDQRVYLVSTAIVTLAGTALLVVLLSLKPELGSTPWPVADRDVATGPAIELPALRGPPAHARPSAARQGRLQADDRARGRPGRPAADPGLDLAALLSRPVTPFPVADSHAAERVAERRTAVDRANAPSLPPVVPAPAVIVVPSPAPAVAAATPPAAPAPAPVDAEENTGDGHEAGKHERHRKGSRGHEHDRRDPENRRDRGHE